MDKQMWIVLIREIIMPIALVTLVPLLTAVLSALVRRVLAQAEKRWGFEVSERHREALDQLIYESLLYAEEQGRKRMHGDASDSLSGSEKMALALGHIKRRGKQLGLEEMVHGYEDAIRESIEARLFKHRLAEARPSTSERRRLAHQGSSEQLTTRPQERRSPMPADAAPLDYDVCPKCACACRGDYELEEIHREEQEETDA
jgi:hypothetical protein